MKFFLGFICMVFSANMLFAELTTEEREVVERYNLEYIDALQDAKSLLSIEHSKWIDYFSQPRIDTMVQALIQTLEKLQQEFDAQLLALADKYPEEEISPLILEDFEKRTSYRKRLLIEGVIFVYLGFAPSILPDRLAEWREIMIKGKLFHRYNQLDDEGIVEAYLMEEAFERFKGADDALLQTMFAEYSEDMEYEDLLGPLISGGVFFNEGLLEELAAGEIPPRSLAEVEFINLHHQTLIRAVAMMLNFIQESGMPL